MQPSDNTSPRCWEKGQVEGRGCCAPVTPNRILNENTSLTVFSSVSTAT
jgi:hypothetical protein